MGALTTVGPVSIDMYLPAFPQMATDFNTSVPRVSWSLSSYFFALALGQFLYGPLLDRFGRKRPIYFGLALHLFASVGCLLSKTIEGLIAFRFLQGLGGCGAQVGAMTMVRDYFSVEKTARVFSLLNLILSVSPLLAPSAGGYIAAHFGWQGVFFALGACVVFVFFFMAFFLRQSRGPNPQVSLRLRPIIQTFLVILKEPQFSVYAITGALVFSGIFAYVGASPVIFMSVFNVSTETYGVLFSMLAFGFISGNQLNLFLGGRFNSAQLLRWGTAGMTLVGGIFFLTAFMGQAGFALTVVLLFFYLHFLGLSNPNAMALALVPFSENAGSASALFGFLQMGTGSLVSITVGWLGVGGLIPIAAILAATAGLSAIALFAGERYHFAN